MVSPGLLADRLRELDNAAGGDRVAGLTDLMDKINWSSPEDNLGSDLAALIRAVISDSTGVIPSRTLLATFISKLREIKEPSTRIAVGTDALEAIAPRAVSLEEQDTAIKFLVADAYVEEEDFTASAKVLQTINLDSSQRTISDYDKAATWIRIMRCYLEEDDPTSALTYLNRTKNVIHGVTDQATRLQFQLSQARISDSQRNFADASRTYYAISQETAIDEDERLHALSAAVVCAILAPAGPQRAQQLSRLFRDERASQLQEHGILEKIFLDRVLDADEVRAFAAKLQPHQLARTSDGSTVLDRAVLDHNILAASRLYSNIGTAQLGAMLGVDAEKAEIYTARMIEERRLVAYIDQIDEVIRFDTRGEGTRAAPGAGSREARLWDANIRSLAEEVEKVTTLIQTEHPAFYAATMIH